jgi:hypothetical protein
VRFHQFTIFSPDYQSNKWYSQGEGTCILPSHFIAGRCLELEKHTVEVTTASIERTNTDTSLALPRHTADFTVD